MSTEQVLIGKLPLEGPVSGPWRRVLTLAAFVIMVGVIVEVVARHDRAEQANRDRFWRVDGPPCAPLDPLSFRGLRRLPQATPYDNALYRRLAGTMTCTHLVDRTGGAATRYPVCKFSGPDYLVVSAGGRDQFYDLTPGRAAAVAIVGGQVRCAVIPPFRM